jgi:hypothetical protein
VNGKLYGQLQQEINLVKVEISLLYNKQTELNNKLQEVCAHEIKIFVNDFSSMQYDFEYCKDCKKHFPIPLILS